MKAPAADARKPFYSQGRYVCRVVGQTVSVTSKENLQFALRVTVLGIPDPTNPHNYFPCRRQYERTWYQVLTNRTFDFAVAHLQAMGYPAGKSLRWLDPKMPGFHSFAGQEIDMYCSHEKYDGQTRERWSPAREAAAASPAAVAKAGRFDELDAMLRERTGALPA